MQKPNGFKRQWPKSTIAEDEPMGHRCALDGSTRSKNENGIRDVPEIIGSQARQSVLAFTAAEGRGGGRVLTGEEGKDSDAILGYVYKIISSFNWIVKSFGQTVLTSPGIRH